MGLTFVAMICCVVQLEVVKNNIKACKSEEEVESLKFSEKNLINKVCKFYVLLLYISSCSIMIYHVGWISFYCLGKKYINLYQKLCEASKCVCFTWQVTLSYGLLLDRYWEMFTDMNCVIKLTTGPLIINLLLSHSLHPWNVTSSNWTIIQLLLTVVLKSKKMVPFKAIKLEGLRSEARMILGLIFCTSLDPHD